MPFGPIAFLGLLGLCLGSFSTTTALRLEQGVSLLGRSSCDHCNQKISWLGLLPLIGFLAQRGRCPNCQSQIPLFYPLTELATGLFAMSLYWALGPQIEVLQLLSLACGLAIISWLDFRTGQIYTTPILFLLGLQLLWYITVHPGMLLSGIIGLLSGAGLFHWVSTLFSALRGKEGLGQGDASLLGLLGFCLGWQALFPLVFLSALLGLLGGAILLQIKGRKLSTQIPFGPFIVLGAVLYRIAPERWLQFFHF